MIDILFGNIHIDKRQLKDVERISESENEYDDRLNQFKIMRETLLQEIKEGE